MAGWLLTDEEMKPIWHSVAAENEGYDITFARAQLRKVAERLEEFQILFHQNHQNPPCGPGCSACELRKEAGLD